MAFLIKIKKDKAEIEDPRIDAFFRSLSDLIVDAKEIKEELKKQLEEAEKEENKLCKKYDDLEDQRFGAGDTEELGKAIDDAYEEYDEAWKIRVAIEDMLDTFENMEDKFSD